MSRGACKGTDRDRFFPGSDWYPGQKWTGADVDPTVEAMCARCDVREQCLRWALEFPEEHGYWAGTTPKDREKLRRGTFRKGCPLCGDPAVFTDAGRQVCLSCGMSWRLRRTPMAGYALANADAAA